MCGSAWYIIAVIGSGGIVAAVVDDAVAAVADTPAIAIAAVIANATRNV